MIWIMLGWVLIQALAHVWRDLAEGIVAGYQQGAGKYDSSKSTDIVKT